MERIKISIITFLAMLVISLWGIGPPVAQAVDETKIPRYFGPYPNWMLSPLPVVNADGTISGGIRKFVDRLPLLGPGGANNLGQYLPVAVPDTITYPGSDYYEIGLVQYREKMHSDLPATLLRGYVQLSTSKVPGQVALSNALLDGGTTAISSYSGVSAPHYLGPVIVATKDRPVRILFRNLLPSGAGGDLFLPVDSTMMGSGMGPMSMSDPNDQGSVTDAVRNPMCTQYPKSSMCFKDNRATLHLHGGVTPWISDGTPHQWVTPADENTPWPKGVSVLNVPDMPDPGPGAMTFFYSNQQSARLMFYHDHSWGITRLNVYAGEAAGYLITDNTEKSLLNAGLIPGAADTIPLIVQDRTFVPNGDKATRTGQLYEQDPTWDENRWGGFGNLWYHHVYMPAQNPGDAGGMSAYGRWMYGPWFWPPATPLHKPIANPYYNPGCNVDDPASWQYQTDPFCEPELIPGTPNISVGMEQFNDTPIVNGTAYPTITLEPKTYRLRFLNAANDRFFNFQWYVADPTTGTGSEVALKASELAAAQDDPVVFPTPDTGISPIGPSWIQIGTEGGFLPAPVVIPNQPTTWITDPTRFDVGNVDKHSLLLAPAERADVIVDFSKYAGQTLILYNDAPAAFPARVASYDYYTGAPDLSPVGAPGILPGYGPNTRTVMQVKIAGSNPAAEFNLTALQSAFQHKADGTGVFESGQPPIIVGQAAYNSAYGTSFASSSWCNAPGSTKTSCDGLVRILEQGGSLFGFNTLSAPTTKFQIPLDPKAIHDEMNSVAFDEFGRMTANLGVEAVPATPAAQNVTLYPYLNPPTEMIDATNLPKAGISITPIATQDGTQIWKITHNGVDTHPIHFHLYDVQLLNRVTWDNIVIKPDANELGWKDTVRVSPLQDTIVALRPIIPTLPFDIPNSVRMLNPMMPAGSTAMFNNIDPQGNPTANIVNQLVNFGWEYVYHCHILSHEEMDMMRPVSVAIPPKQPDGLSYAITGSGNNRRVVLSWNDNSLSETGFLVQKSSNGTTWTDIGTSQSPLDQENTTGRRSLIDPSSYNANAVTTYRVVALNTVGYGGQFPVMTVKSVSVPLAIGAIPAVPSNLTATLQNGPQIRFAWRDNANNETGFVIQRSVNGGGFTSLTSVGANVTSYTDTAVASGNAYKYQVAAVNVVGASAYVVSGTVTILSAPSAPSNLTALRSPATQVVLNWTDTSNNETSFSIQRATNSTFTSGLTTFTVAVNATTFTNTVPSATATYYYRVRAVNSAGNSAYATVGPVLPTAALTVTAVTPAVGSSTGGTAVTITGSNFLAGAAVSFGGTAATNVNVVSSTSITATTPAHAIGPVAVTVTNTGGANATLVNGFTYTATPTVTAVAPVSGSTAGGTAVTITGTNFVSGAAVSFGGVAATSVTVVGSTSITATTPANPAGPVAVTVANPGNLSGTLANGYTYITVAVSTYSIFPANAVPAVAADPDTAAVELGMKFTSTTAGRVTGVRYYKSTANSGTHVGSLWSANGTLLARVTFTGESASGWQQANFTTPVAITPNTTYVISYHTNVGRYAGDNNYFTTARTSGPLTAPANSTTPNGVYAYSANPAFPASSWNSSNYWVDVVFATP